MAQEEQKISLIAAIGEHTRALGKDNALLFSIPADLKRFKELTSGHPVIMGRKTWESLPEKFRPLPGRTNIVVTRDKDYPALGATLAQTFPEALSYAKDAEGSSEIFVIGGGEVYRAALPFASHLYLTLVDSDLEGDVTFPAYEEDFTNVISEEYGEYEGLQYRFVTLTRG